MNMVMDAHFVVFYFKNALLVNAFSGQLAINKSLFSAICCSPYRSFLHHLLPGKRDLFYSCSPEGAVA